MKKKAYVVKIVKKKKLSDKEQRAHHLFYRAMADFLSAISDINNEYGTSFTAADLYL